MAPLSDRVYFPSLDECLTGDRVILSWKLAATALTDTSGQRQASASVIDFFDDEYVHALLNDPSKVFPLPSDASAKDFETKTAPINVTAESNERYDLQTLKDDAKWLSQHAKIDLVSALRLVVIEFQSRPAQYLLGQLSSQDVKNLQEAVGHDNAYGVSFVSELAGNVPRDSDEIREAFDKPDARRLRAFQVYLSERRYFMKASEYAHSIKLYGRLPTYASVDLNLAQVYRLKQSTSKDQVEPLLSAYLQALSDCVNEIAAGIGAVTQESILLTDEVEVQWLRALLTEAFHVLSILFQLVDSLGDNFAPSSAVNRWFSLMDSFSFFDTIQPIDDSIAELILPLQSLSCATSLAFLKPASSLTYLHERDEDPTRVDAIPDLFLLSSDVLEQVHTTMINAANADSGSASPIIFAWAVILHQMNVSYQNRTEKRDNLLQQNARETFETGTLARPSLPRRNSAGSIFSIESSKFDGFLENVTVPKDLQVVEQLASMVTSQGKVYDVISRMADALGDSLQGSLSPLISSRSRAIFLELLKVSYPFVGYQSDPVTALASLLSGGRTYWDLDSAKNLSVEQDILASMLSDDQLLEFYLQQAMERYPYEFLPFITLCRRLSSATSPRDDEQPYLIQHLLRQTPTMTLVLPPGFQGYELVQEDENTNSFCLLEDIPLISLSSSWSRRYIEDDAYRIPAGTMGRFITDSGRVAMMDYSHSTIALLGRRLEINLAKEGYRCELGVLQPEEVAETICLFATLIRTDDLKAAEAGAANSLVVHDSELIQEASRHISGGRDIITVVCETMDYFMQDELSIPEDTALSVLSSCIQFLDAVLPAQPSRVWSYLARCDFLNSESRAGKLAKLTGALDMLGEKYDLLSASTLLFSHLIETAKSSAVQRRAGNKIAGQGQQRAPPNPWLGASDKVLSKVCMSIARASVDMFENTSTWRFDSDVKRISLLNQVLPVLTNLILYSYSMGDPLESDNLSSCLRPAASYIINSFVSPSTGTLRFQPLLQSYVASFSTTGSTVYPTRQDIVHCQVRLSLEFPTTLLKVANVLELSSNMVETFLFKCSTLLARLGATSGHYLAPALWALSAVVVNAGNNGNDPPSLLGYLGPQTSKSYLQLLSTLGKPFVLTQEVTATWKFFSAILRNRQQWMSNCLLTGQTPREAMSKDNKKTTLSRDSVFALALEKLSSLKKLPASEALVILDFVASAQNYWPWTVFTLQKETTYLDGLRDYVRELSPSHITSKANGAKAGNEARIAAYIAETFSMQLYHSRHLGNADKLASSLIPDLDYYVRDGVEVAGYNKSLHNNFAINFASRYPGCSLDDFKRTVLWPRELGTNYYYDLTLADDMLRFDPGWTGRKDNGYKAEMERANTNLSLVDAQIALYHAWEFLLVELGTCLPTNETINRQMLQVAQQCLNANQVVPGPESIFKKLVRSRANLALVLVQRLARSSLPAKDVTQIFVTLVGAINEVDEPFADGIEYYRTLLKALFVILRAYQIPNAQSQKEGEGSVEEPSVMVVQTVLNVLDRVVGMGFRALVSLVHDNEASVVPEDLALLTAILQACLSLPSIEQSQTQILNIMASHDAVHAATSLFSWADKLAVQGDPIYGELSILFLFELSRLPLIAEQLACDGILSSLLSSNLAKYMLRAKLSPYSDSLVAQRCYGIWAKGFLPLMLNLLTALGATVAPEIAYVLNQFPHLLQLSVDRFEAPGASRTSKSTEHYLTLLSSSETHSLALLTRILAGFRLNNNRDISDVEWDAAGLLENVEFWLSSKRLLKERLLPLGQREMDWRAIKKGTAENGGYDNLLEEKVVRQLEAIRDVLSEELDAE